MEDRDGEQRNYGWGGFKNREGGFGSWRYLDKFTLLNPPVQYDLTHERVIGEVAHDTF